MPQDELPRCTAPDCLEEPEAKFLALTPLCRHQAIKGHRRATGNVLVVGPVVAAIGGGLVLLDLDRGPLFWTGGAAIVAGGLLTGLGPLFWLLGRRLSRQP